MGFPRLAGLERSFREDKNCPRAAAEDGGTGGFLTI
jgi:hypothetical protein